ncbi:MAG: hypothetical protein GXO22_07825 [Aquificae bacterium]|nr:hypothetical protein [Aquificota bacterium]
MGKIIKFSNADDNEDRQPKTDKKDNTVIKTFNNQKEEFNLQLEIKKAIESYLLENFAVKNVLGIDIVYKTNKAGEFGTIGIVLYEHKRKSGTFQADFIAKGIWDKNKNKVYVTELAFSAGEPELYKTIFNFLKAKHILPTVTG